MRKSLSFSSGRERLSIPAPARPLPQSQSAEPSNPAAGQPQKGAAPTGKKSRPKRQNPRSPIRDTARHAPSQRRKTGPQDTGHSARRTAGPAAHGTDLQAAEPAAGQFSSEQTQAASSAQSPAGSRGSQADVIIIGAGAAGLFCSRLLSLQGVRVLLLERGAVPGRKLAVSGGGKANFSNRHITVQHYLCHNAADFCAPALKAFSPQAMLSLMRHWGLPVEERDHGQLFLTVQAQKLVQALLHDCQSSHLCTLCCQCEVATVQRRDGAFVVQSRDKSWSAPCVVLAGGSPAWPQAGGCGHGYALAQSLGHRMIPPRAALTPLRLDATVPLHAALLALTGISLPVRISLPALQNKKQRQYQWKDDLLFTHDSLSGPAALKASLYWQQGLEIALDFLPEDDLKALLDDPGAGRQTARALLARLLPQRLVDALLPQETARRRLAELSRAARTEIIRAVQDCRITPLATAGLKKAEVCAGGVNTEDVDRQSMESSLCPGLYLLGELLDVTGLLGGYNLHWAWASATLAARHILQQKLKKD